MKDLIQELDLALIALLQTKAKQEITVFDLCEQAQVSRSAFYNHYSDIAALETTFCQRTEEKLSGFKHTSDDFSWIFSYIAENNDVFTAYFKLPYFEKHNDYKMLFFRKGVYSVAKLWFESGCKESPEQMGEIINREYHKLFQ